MRITEADLIELGACVDQLNVFDDAWPDGAEVTRDNCIRADELGLDLEWIVRYRCTATAIIRYRGRIRVQRTRFTRSTAIPRAARDNAIRRYTLEANPGNDLSGLIQQANTAYSDTIRRMYILHNRQLAVYAYEALKQTEEEEREDNK